MNRLPPCLSGTFGTVLAGLMVLTGCMLVPTEARAQRGLDLENDTLTQSAPVHPPIDVSDRRMNLSTREHTYRPPLRLVDQLARDFTVMKVRTVMKVGDDGIGRAYKPGTAGKENEDWCGKQDVLAPFESKVVRVARPDSTDEPRFMNQDGKTGLIAFEDEEDGITIGYAHIREIEVEEGDTASRGDVVGRVGNNGTSRAPHVHVGTSAGEPNLLGAESGAEPLQVQVDLYAEKRGEDMTGRWWIEFGRDEYGVWVTCVLDIEYILWGEDDEYDSAGKAMAEADHFIRQWRIENEYAPQ